MQEMIALARPYALAAFEHAKAEQEIADWGAALRFLAAVVSDDAVSSLITDPRVGDDRIAELVLQLCEGQLTPSRENFVKLLVENGRVGLAPAIAAVYEKEQARAEGRARVEVISAYELDAKLRQMLTGAMAKRLGREVELSVTVDGSLIGGAIIRSGDVVIDGSLRGRLRQLHSEFA